MQLRGEAARARTRLELAAAAGAAAFTRGGLATPAAVGVASLIVMAAFALTQGAASIPVGTVARLLLDALPFVQVDANASSGWQSIVLDVRLPRVLAAGLVGASLAYAGAAYQGVFRNPLADPFLLGVASGAALGASIAIISSLPIDAYGFGWVPLFAFVGALITVVLVYLLALQGGAIANVTLILAGVALSAVFSAITSFILLTGGEEARPIFSFIFGGFNTASWERVLVALPYLAISMLVIGGYTRVLNVLQLDEEQAAQLGVNVTRTKVIVLIAASLLAATAVAIAGVIGFVGLIVPHAVRLAFGVDYRRVLPLAALWGATFLIGSDVLARSILEPQDVPVGIVTAIAGGPFFLILLRTRKAGGL